MSSVVNAVATKRAPSRAPAESRDRSVAGPRISKLRDELLATEYSICLERPRLLLQGRKAARRAGETHPLVSRAMALAWVNSHRRPRIYEDELIIGNLTSKRVAANYYPEGGSINVVEDLFRLDRRTVPLRLSRRERFRLVTLAARTLPMSVGARALLRPGRVSHFLDFFRAKRYFVTEEAGISHQVVDYEAVVRRGLHRAAEKARDHLDSGALEDGSPLSPDQVAFYRSVVITVDGIRSMARNLAAEAERASREPGVSPERREELVVVAEAVRRVPFEPARSFREGLQACWLIHVALNLEDFEQGLSFGRLDQILYPLYRQDVDAGHLTPEEATELVASFQLKTCEAMPLYSERIDHFFSGNAVAQGITLGGTDTEGNDVTNELSGIFLDAYAQVRTREPALHVRLHDESPAWFVDRAVGVVQLGCGKPSFFGDRAVTRALKRVGMSEAHARDYAVIGCVEMASQGRTYNSSDAALFNLPLCLELALAEGRQFAGGRRIGAGTPAAADIRTFDQLVEAYREQVRHAVDEMVEVIGWLEETYRTWRPTPLNSIFTQGCLENALDVTWGGALYNLTSIQVVGLADVGDSLAAVERLVFEEGRLTLSELVEILAGDFVGQEALRTELAMKMPRFGNGDARADRMTQVALDAFTDAVTAHRNGRGGRYAAGVYTMTCGNAFGRVTGALPNGRRSGERISNGMSPVDGADRRGPTAVLRSVASLDSRDLANGYALNIKFEKKMVDGEAGRQALCGLLLAHLCDEGGMQVQMNVLDADMLRAAQMDPSTYPGIVVRVAGYCAYFNDLQRDVQDEIIARTAHGRLGDT